MKIKITSLRFFKIIFFFSFLLAFYSCEKEEILPTVQEQQAEIVHERQAEIVVKTLTKSEIENNKTIYREIKQFETHNAKVLSKQIGDTLYEFTINTSIGKYIEKGDYHSYSFPIQRGKGKENGNLENLLLSLKPKGGYNVYLVKYGFTSRELGLMDRARISATKTIFKPINFDYSEVLENTSSLKLSTYLMCVDNWDYLPVEGGELLGCPGSNTPCPLYEWTLVSTECTYVVGGGGSTGGGGDTGGDNGTSNVGGGTGSGGEVETISAPVIGGNESEEVVVHIFNNLAGKANCTFLKLQNNSLLTKTLEKFFGEETPIHLVLSQESNLRNDDEEFINGTTIYGDSFYITIKLNTEQANNRPSLDVARTILHEAIHAEIYRKIKSTTPDISRIIINSNSWPTLFDYYNNYPNNPQHNYMADYYRTAMVQGLKEYATSIGVNYPDQLYEDLAWSGLRGTNAWENMFADPVYTEQEQTRILNSIINFSNSGNNECE